MNKWDFKEKITFVVFVMVFLSLSGRSAQCDEGGGAPVMGRVIPCVDAQTQERLQTIDDVGVERVLSRKILEWSPSLGTWGRISPRFFGLFLEQQDTYPQEWLVLTVWGAAEWLLLDDQWVLAHANQHSLQKPLYCLYVPRQWDSLSHQYIEAQTGWDNFSPLIVGGVITEVYFRNDSSLIKIEKDGITHVLEIPWDKTLLPPNGGNGQYKILNPGQSLAVAWVIAPSGELSVRE